MFRLVNKEIIDRLKVVRSQETLLIFNENVEMAVAHISVRYCATVVHAIFCFYLQFIVVCLFYAISLNL